jgi:hypothetical protein
VVPKDVVITRCSRPADTVLKRRTRLQRHSDLVRGSSVFFVLVLGKDMSYRVSEALRSNAYCWHGCIFCCVCVSRVVVSAGAVMSGMEGTIQGRACLDWTFSCDSLSLHLSHVSGSQTVQASATTPWPASTDAHSSSYRHPSSSQSLAQHVRRPIDEAGPIECAATSPRTPNAPPLLIIPPPPHANLSDIHQW